MNTTIATFYRFAAFPDFAEWQQPLRQFMEARGMKGSILLASEGINATIAGAAKAVQETLEYIQKDQRFAGLDVKYAQDDHAPFSRPKVRLKESIITLGHETPNAACLTGTQCNPAEWDALIDNPEVVILDTRNVKETYLGTFRSALLWPISSSSQITTRIEQYFEKDQKIGMFCTGGVRCEKLSSWMLDQGYQHLYQLEGGIIRYLEKVPEEKSHWLGSCYVFDERIAVTHGNVTDRSVSLCPGCDHPLKAEDRNHPAYVMANQCGFCV